MIGKTLAHYEITSLLGRGGMGEVYKAKDQKLGRDVAIKVLPEEFAKDTDRVARFQREAKLLASLNHPNIAAIYGLEESDGTHFLVLELIEGNALADRIKAGPISVEEALKLALQIAEALEAAHEKGVIHRDLKPANIKVTPDGKVKVLDFGLAKAFAGDQGEMILSDSPTLSVAATQKGVILGTAAYMSPEQAKGKTVNKRADIWAFGAVLYEMLTGKAAFQGDDVTEILASVVKASVNLDLLPSNIHPRVREIISRCLQKDLQDRYRDVGDAQYEIKQVLADPSGVFVQPVTTVKPRRKVRVGLSWIAVTAILSIIIAGVAVWYLKPSESRQVHRFYYDLPEDQEFSRPGGRMVAVSADGTKIVYVANKQLYLKNSNELTAKSIQGTDEDPMNPFFSPDGQWVGYFSTSDGQLKKIAIMGGAPVTLCEFNIPWGAATWGADDMIVFGEQGGIMRVSANGGTPEQIVKGESELFYYPQILPDEETVLFAVRAGGGLQVAVQSLESGQRKDLFAGGPTQYLPTGHLVYALENNLFTIPFDLDALEVSGGPVPMVEGVFQYSPDLSSQSAISDSGTLVYIPGTMGAMTIDQRTLVWVDREGKEEPLSAQPSNYRQPAISPDGTKLAIRMLSQGNWDIWIWDFVRETMTRLTSDESLDANPLWTPDGKHVVFSSNREGSISIYRKAADGTGEVEPLASLPNRQIYAFSWSQDGNTLMLEEQSGGQYDIGAISTDGEHTRKLLLQEDHNEGQPEISPDGLWMAYVSNESGQYEVYVRPFPEVNKSKWPISTSGGNSPLWSPNGLELFYRNDDSVMAVSVETEPTFNPGKPKMLFSGTYSTEIPPWDIHPDGKRFLMMKPLETTDDESTDESTAETPRKIIVVTNWFEELKERVPVK